MSRYSDGGPEPRIQSTVSRREPYGSGLDRYRERGDRDRSRDRGGYDRDDYRRSRQRDDRDEDQDRSAFLLDCLTNHKLRIDCFRNQCACAGPSMEIT